MSTRSAVAVPRSRLPDVENAPVATVSGGARRIALTTPGRRHGPVARLVSPSDIGELIKPFVFLDHFEIVPRPDPLFGIHPHSGIATLTVVLRGGVVYEDTTGKAGTVPTGGIEWMKAGNGVWHDGGATPGEPLRGFQLWVALPPSEENAPAESQYISPDAVQEDGPVRVILGRYGSASSPIRAPAGINYFHVRLTDGQRWRYVPPDGHTVAWLAVDEGGLRSHAPIHAAPPDRPKARIAPPRGAANEVSVGAVDTGELAVFEESGGAIELEADGDTS